MQEMGVTRLDCARGSENTVSSGRARMSLLKSG